jgi:GAF domain-containing protein
MPCRTGCLKWISRGVAWTTTHLLTLPADKLLPRICAELVGFGRMKMAWIGSLDDSKQRIISVSWAGEGTDYLDGLEITLDPDLPSGQGPAGTALRENQPFWCQDCANDLATRAWHERAKKYGWAASAALPLHRDGQVVGLFSLCAYVAHAFDTDAQALLLEMAMDISFALQRFADARESAYMQKALRDSEARYRKAFQTSPYPAWHISTSSPACPTATSCASVLILSANSPSAAATSWR